MITIRRIQKGESSIYKKIRLASLKEAPYAFASTYESAAKRTEESWAKQSDSTAESSSNAIFLAFENENPIGIAAIYENEEKNKEAEIFQVWVAPDHRGTDLAKNMIDKVFDWAGRNRYENVLAVVEKNNDRASKFYLNYGFKITSETEFETKMKKEIRTRQCEKLG